MKEKEWISVALDGPSGAGKSSVARAAAKRLGFLYIDTGALYRTIALAILRAGVDRNDAEAVAKLLPSIQIALQHDKDGVQRMLLEQEDVSEEIRTPEISAAASVISAYPPVRAFLLETQREIARQHDVIMDGRDIGTVVLPDAEVKIFLTASAEARARRRYQELAEKGIETSYEAVLEENQRRDAHDSTRLTAPLRKAEEAVTVDTSDLTFAESVDVICRLILEKTGK